MIHQETKTIKVVSLQSQQTQGFVNLQIWDEAEQVKRAWKGLGTCWGLAIASVFLPVAHFVLVPGFLTGGPILFYILKRQKSQILGGEAKCPQCEAKVMIQPQPSQWPIEGQCENCRAPFKAWLED